MSAVSQRRATPALFVHREENHVANGLVRNPLVFPLTELSASEKVIVQRQINQINKFYSCIHGLKILGIIEIIVSLVSALLFGTNPLFACFGVALTLPSFFLSPRKKGFDYGNIRPGDIITRQDAAMEIVAWQKGIGLGKHASSTHFAMVRSVSEGKIDLFESVYRFTNGKLLNGVRTDRYDFASFKEWVNRGIRILRPENPALQEQLKKTIEEMASNYEGPDQAIGAYKTTYSFLRLVTSPVLSSASSEEERKRTLYSLKAKALMNAHDKPREEAICTETAAEVVRVSQVALAILTHGVSDNPTTADLKKLEEDGFLLNAGETIIPGTLEARLVEKHKFQYATIYQSDLIPF